MKTLDEVIKALELCSTDDNPCDKCPYTEFNDKGVWACSMCGDFAEDALHYLRVFRDAKDALDTERDRYAEAVRNCEVAENKYKRLCEETSQNLVSTSQNDSISWDELKTMKGKPVWIELHYKGCKPWSGWEIVDDVDDKWMTTHQDDYAREQMCEYWQAYRKERE